MQSEIALSADILVDILRVDQAAVAECNTVLLCVECGFVEGFDMILTLDNGLVIEELLDGAAADEMLVHDARDHVHADMGIERAFRINDHDRDALAKAEASGADDKDLLGQALFLEQSLKLIGHLHGTGRGTSGTAAHQDMLFIFCAACILAETERHFSAHSLLDCSQLLQSLHSKPPIWSARINRRISQESR